MNVLNLFALCLAIVFLAGCATPNWQGVPTVSASEAMETPDGRNRERYVYNQQYHPERVTKTPTSAPWPGSGTFQEKGVGQSLPAQKALPKEAPQKETLEVPELTQPGGYYYYHPSAGIVYGPPPPLPPVVYSTVPYHHPSYGNYGYPYGYGGYGYSGYRSGRSRKLFGVAFTPRYDYEYYYGPATIHRYNTLGVFGAGEVHFGTAGRRYYYGW